MPHYKIIFTLYNDKHGKITVSIIKFAETVTEAISWINQKYPNALIHSIEEVH
jgi:hypothetical protein